MQALRRMVSHLIENGEALSGWGSQLLRSASDARSYDGQYAPWVQALADQADHDLRMLSEEVDDLGHSVAYVATAFEQADAAEARGFGAWAGLIRSMVEQGQDPIGLMPGWARTLGRPPWINEADWIDMPWDERQQIILDYQNAWMEQQARIDRLTTPPWEKDERWLWAVTGINPDLAGVDGMLAPGEVRAMKDQLELTRQEYDRKWAEFLESQSLYKFGAGDDMGEAFLIYLFGLEGAAAHGVGTIVVDDQRLLGMPRFQYSAGEVDQYLILNGVDGVPEFLGKGYGSDFSGDFGAHYNLCGQLATAVTIGVDPIEGLIAFERTNRGPSVLADQTVGTGHAQLTNMLGEFGWEGERVGNASDPYPWRDDRGWQPKPDQVAEHLEQGRALIALVGLNTRTGLIDPAGPIPHWVSVLQVVESQDGEAYARIYNPYQNREEWYSFDHLAASWAPGPNYRAVVATPPMELAWLPNP